MVETIPMKQKILLVAALFLASCNHSPKERSISSLSEKEIDGLWVAVSKRKDSLIRSNPQHFWAWMEANSRKSLGDLVKHEGEITADPHFFNFGDIHSENGQNGLALVDVDDSGTGSLVLDFVRYSLFVKAYIKDQHKEASLAKLGPQMYKAYLKGLAQDKMIAPAVFQNAINNSRQKLERENQKWVEENVDDFKKKDFGLRKKEIGLLSLDKIPKRREEAGKDLKNALLKGDKVKEIFDIGFSVNDSGSSRGLSRYWFSTLLRDKETHRLIECKELSKPATEFYKKQLNHTARIDNVLRYYSDYKTNDSYVMTVAQDSYWCRPREFEFLRRSHIEKLSLAGMEELSVYLAFWIGSKQSLQPSGKPLLNSLNASDKVYEKIDKLINGYERHIDSIPAKN